MLLKQFDDLADQVIEAIVADAANPDIRANIQNQLDQIASRVIGRDVNSPLIKPFWNNICETAVRYIEEQVTDFISVAVSDPPDSVDGAASFVKEEVNTKVDSIADRLKKKLAEQKKH